MLTKLDPIIVETNSNDDNNQVDDLLIEQIWLDLSGQVPRKQIRQAALEIASEFQNATVTTFVPIFIRRLTRERLQNHDKCIKANKIANN